MQAVATLQACMLLELQQPIALFTSLTIHCAPLLQTMAADAARNWSETRQTNSILGCLLGTYEMWFLGNRHRCLCLLSSTARAGEHPQQDPGSAWVSTPVCR